LENLKKLKSLILQEAKITDEGMKSLAGLTELTELSLFRCNDITDAGLVALKDMTKMKNLSLRQLYPVNGEEGFDHLQGMKDLEILDIAETDVSDEAFAKLTGLTKLKHLSAWNTWLSDEGAKSLAKLTNLEFLDVHGTQLSNAGLKDLEPLKSLKTLELSGAPGVTREGVEAFKQAVPGCDVRF
jgi:hypothetical protein